MIINGLSPGVAYADPAATSLEKEELEQDINIEKRELEKTASPEKPKDEDRKSPANEMNDYYLKELLFLMSSKGNSATIEKLAQLLKKERETLTRIK